MNYSLRRLDTALQNLRDAAGEAFDYEEFEAAQYTLTLELQWNDIRVAKRLLDEQCKAFQALSRARPAATPQIAAQASVSSQQARNLAEFMACVEESIHEFEELCDPEQLQTSAFEASFDRVIAAVQLEFGEDADTEKYIADYILARASRSSITNEQAAIRIIDSVQIAERRLRAAAGGAESAVRQAVSDGFAAFRLALLHDVWPAELVEYLAALQSPLEVLQSRGAIASDLLSKEYSTALFAHLYAEARYAKHLQQAPVATSQRALAPERWQLVAISRENGVFIWEVPSKAFGVCLAAHISRLDASGEYTTHMVPAYSRGFTTLFPKAAAAWKSAVAELPEFATSSLVYPTTAIFDAAQETLSAHEYFIRSMAPHIDALRATVAKYAAIGEQASLAADELLGLLIANTVDMPGLLAHVEPKIHNPFKKMS